MVRLALVAVFWSAASGVSPARPGWGGVIAAGSLLLVVVVAVITAAKRRRI